MLYNTKYGIIHLVDIKKKRGTDIVENLMSNENMILMDFHSLSVSNSGFESGKTTDIAYYDMFFRTNPDNGGFVIMAGVEQMAEKLKNLSFSQSDIDYLKDKGLSEGFLNYLKNFTFSCDVWAVPEGTPVFPGEPVVTVRGPAIEAQLIETIILLSINHQSLIATKANRISRAAQGHSVVELGMSQAHGADAAVFGARAAFIGGCDATTCTPAARMFGIPVFESMTHSWVQMFDSELEAFCAYASIYPDSCTILVDTFNTLKSGLPNAIEAFNRVLIPNGHRPKAIRIDSGDIAYLSRKARKMLDEAGFPDCEIIASNSLDEYIIRDMLLQGARVDTFGVGERLITSASSPVFDGVYKLSALERNGIVEPKIKLSENVAKITVPCFKKIYRLFDRDTGKALADLITLADEEINEREPYELFDPNYTWKRKTVENFVARSLLKQIFDKGRYVYNQPPLSQIKAYCSSQIDTLWNEVLRFENPHNYYVDLSQALYDEKKRLIDGLRN